MHKPAWFLVLLFTLVPAILAAEDEPGFVQLFNGKDLTGWRHAGPGEFTVENGELATHGGMGMLWYEKEMFKDFVLRVDWKVSRVNDNSGIFTRIPEKSDDPWFAVNHSYEIQIQDDRDPDHRTGANYGFNPAVKVASKPPGGWNTFEITAVGQKYTVKVNGETVCEFMGNRALEGYFGLQNHDEKSRVAFKNIRIKKLNP